MMSNADKVNILDTIGAKEGWKEIKVFFQNTLSKEKENSIKILNDDNLSYTALFILREDIRKAKILNELSKRNSLALLATDRILSDTDTDENRELLTLENINLLRSSLLWVLKTGAKDDGLNDDFDEVLDKAAILLVKIFRAKEALPLIVDLIFKRYLKEYFIHDLVWALFESRELSVLPLIARKLLSSDTKEYELACKLLNFVPFIEYPNRIDSRQLYVDFNNWFFDNSSFLYYTGESFQLTRNPIPFVIVNEAKYLCKPVSIETGKPIDDLKENEALLLDEFNKLNDNEKSLLSDYSFKIHHESFAYWEMWINKPINEQIIIAKKEMGGYYD